MSCARRAGCTDAREGEVAQRVMVGRSVPVGPIAPAVPVPPVTGVEGGPVIGQEIPAPAAAEGRQGRFRDHGVPFQEPGAGIDTGQGAGKQVSHQPFERTEQSVSPELELGDMAVFVDGQGGQPGHRLRLIRLRQGIQVHATGRPGHAAVGLPAMGMQDDRHGFAVHAAGQVSDAPADLRAEGLQGTGIGPGQGVHPRGVDQFVMVRTEGGPTDGSRVLSAGIELGPGGACQQHSHGPQGNLAERHLDRITSTLQI